MGEENIDLGVGTFYINGQECGGVVTRYDFEDHREDTESYLKENMVLRMKDPCTFTVTAHVSLYGLLIISGVWDWVLENCPDRRVKHLMLHGKKERIRRKNFYRAIRLIARRVKHAE